MSEPTATVRKVNGQLVLDDPIAYAVMTVVERYNLYQADLEAVQRLEARAKEKGGTGAGFTVIVIDVDVYPGIVEGLMPGHDWEQYRARGEKPVARGLVPRAALVGLLETIPEDERVIPNPLPAGVFTAVFGRGGVSVFEARS